MKVWIIGIMSMVLLVFGSIGLLLVWDSAKTTTAAIDPPSGAGPGGDYVRVTTTTTTAGDAPPAAAAAPVPPPLPACVVGDEPVASDPLTDWATIVVDTNHRLDGSFTPPDLVPVSAAGFPGNDSDLVRTFVIGDLAALRQAAEDNGTPFYVVSGFRSFEYQRNLFDSRVQSEGLEVATALTARPGHSEHQLGTTIDVLDPGSEDLTTDFGATPPGQWIAAHGHEYGFVLSYPDGSRDQTCYDFEPWHIRYVGRDVAGQIHRSGLSPREYLLTRPVTERGAGTPEPAPAPATTAPGTGVAG